jgi:hypothetical protein
LTPNLKCIIWPIEHHQNAETHLHLDASKASVPIKRLIMNPMPVRIVATQSSANVVRPGISAAPIMIAPSEKRKTPSCFPKKRPAIIPKHDRITHQGLERNFTRKIGRDVAASAGIGWLRAHGKAEFAQVILG